jgi:hypothetical protein
MGKRWERVAPPPRPGGWDFRYVDSSAAVGWGKVCAAAPANARTAWERITADPRQRDVRQHPLRGDLGTRMLNGMGTDPLWTNSRPVVAIFAGNRG